MISLTYGKLVFPEVLFEDLKVYPNPVAERVHISFNGIENYTAIMLYDMAELASGAYFIRIMMEDDSKVVTVIKQ